MTTHFEQIKKAIIYLKDHVEAQPSLEEVAKVVHMSPFHFQKVFTEWAGVSPKQFLKFLSISYAKAVLVHSSSLLEASHQIGLSGTGRLHDLFVTIEGMTPGEYKHGGRGLTLKYTFEDTPLGAVFIASTEKGICHLSYADSIEEGTAHVRRTFPETTLMQASAGEHEALLSILRYGDPQKIKLHLKGTTFQIKVWEALLRIPEGALTTYGDIAQMIGHEKAYRAVGTAVGDNPVAFLVPCHRVIRGTGILGNYEWGPERKVAMIGWEMAHTDTLQ